MGIEPVLTAPNAQEKKIFSDIFRTNPSETMFFPSESEKFIRYDVFFRHFVGKIHQSCPKFFSYAYGGLSRCGCWENYFDTADGIYHQWEWKIPTDANVPTGLFNSVCFGGT